MRDARSADLEVVGDVNQEDGTQNEGEARGGEPRPR